MVVLLAGFKGTIRVVLALVGASGKLEHRSHQLLPLIATKLNRSDLTLTGHVSVNIMVFYSSWTRPSTHNQCRRVNNQKVPPHTPSKVAYYVPWCPKPYVNRTLRAPGPEIRSHVLLVSRYSTNCNVPQQTCLPNFYIQGYEAVSKEGTCLICERHSRLHAMRAERAAHKRRTVAR